MILRFLCYLSISVLFALIFSCKSRKNVHTNRYIESEITSNDSLQNIAKQDVTFGNNFVDSNLVFDSKKHFFDFDYVMYYHCEISEENAGKLQTLAFQKDPSIDLRLLFFDFKDSIGALDFIPKLNNTYFKKQAFPRSKYKDLLQIMQTKKTAGITRSRCMPVYRDLLFFKKNNSIVGCVQICFQCELFNFVGARNETVYFGQNGEFEKLKQLLKQ